MGEVAMIAAVELPDTGILEMLLEAGGDPDANTDGMYYTALQRAAKRDNIEAAELLIDHGATHVGSTPEGYTPLACAVFEGHVEMARFLLDHGADPMQDGIGYIVWFGKSVVTLAIENEDEEMLALLRKYGADIHTEWDGGVTELHHVAECSTVDAARHLIAHGLDVNAATDQGVMPIHAVRAAEMVDYLVSQGADVDALTASGESALHCAARDRRTVGVVGALLRNGANPHVTLPEDYGSAHGLKTPLHFAADFHGRGTEELLMAGADPNARDGNGNTPLHLAWGVDRVEVLLQHGADPNVKNGSGRTPVELVDGDAAKPLLRAAGTKVDPTPSAEAAAR
jgi:cytohesin